MVFTRAIDLEEELTPEEFARVRQNIRSVLDHARDQGTPFCNRKGEPFTFPFISTDLIEFNMCEPNNYQPFVMHPDPAHPQTRPWTQPGGENSLYDNYLVALQLAVKQAAPTKVRVSSDMGTRPESIMKGFQIYGEVTGRPVEPTLTREQIYRRHPAVLKKSWTKTRMLEHLLELGEPL